MLGVLLVGAVTASPSPLPIIITTTSSPICQALREKIAPAIAGLAAEDQVFAGQHPFAVKGSTIYHLAENWIYVDKLLDPDTFFHSDDPKQQQQMETLRERLQTVADDDNTTLNVLSGTFDTLAFEDLMARGTPIKLTFTRGDVGKSDSTPAIYNHGGAIEAAYQARRETTQRAELDVYPALAPIIAQCK